MDNSQNNELQVLKNFCLEALQIVSEKYRSDHKEDIQTLKSFELIKKVIIDDYNKGRLKALKSSSSDIIDPINHYTFWEKQAADKRLQERTGIGLKNFEVARNKKIQELLKLGNVNNADEYRLLESRVEEIFEKNPDLIEDNEEVKKINLILGKITKPFIEE